VATPFGNGAGTLRMAGGNLLVSADRGTAANNIQNPVVFSANGEFQANGTSEPGTWFSRKLHRHRGHVHHSSDGAAGTGGIDVRLTNTFTFTRPLTFAVDNAGNIAQLSVWNRADLGDQAYTGLITDQGASAARSPPPARRQGHLHSTEHLCGWHLVERR